MGCPTEDESYVPRKDNKSEGEDKCAKVALWNEDGNDSYNDIDEEMDDVKKMKG